MINQVNNQSSICESLTDVTTHFELVLAGYVGELSVPDWSVPLRQDLFIYFVLFTYYLYMLIWARRFLASYYELLYLRVQVNVYVCIGLYLLPPKTINIKVYVCINSLPDYSIIQILYSGLWGRTVSLRLQEI